jgi:hypothetical protein
MKSLTSGKIFVIVNLISWARRGGFYGYFWIWGGCGKEKAKPSLMKAVRIQEDVSTKMGAVDAWLERSMEAMRNCILMGNTART